MKIIMFLFLFMRIIKIKKLYNAPSMQLLMELSLVSAMGCVGLVDVAVSRFESPVNTGFVDDTGTAVVRQHTEEQRIIRSEIVIEGDEPAEIPAEKGIRLSLGELDTSSERLSRLHHMSVSDRRPVAWAVERLELLYNQHGAFKRRQVHYAFSRVGGGRCCRKGQQRHEEHYQPPHRTTGITGLTTGLRMSVLSLSSLSLLLNSNVRSHGVEPKLSSTTTRYLCSPEDFAV